MSRANQSFLRTDWSQIERVFYMTAPAPCPYLPHRTERKLITALDFGEDEAFDQLSWSGFRRSHEIAYRPACPSCNACKSARIDVARHRPSRTQAKIMRRNADLSRSVQPAQCTTEHWALFDRYIRNRHGDSEMALMTPDDLRMMIEQTTVDSGLLEWRDAEGSLRACMLFDAMADGFPPSIRSLTPKTPAARWARSAFSMPWSTSPVSASRSSIWATGSKVRPPWTTRTGFPAWKCMTRVSG